MKAVKAFFILAAVLVIVYTASEVLDSSQSEMVSNETDLVVGTPTEPNKGVNDTDVIIDAPIIVEQPRDVVKENKEEPTKEPSVEPKEEPEPIRTFPEDAYDVELETEGLSNVKQEWSFGRNTKNVPPVGYTKSDLSQYGAYYVRETQDKVMYLTFDEGYENGYTAPILDILKENEVHAAFFVTKPYIKNNPELVKRMKEEGHLVANHSVTHKSFPSLTDEQVVQELRETAEYFYEVTGYEMDPFFRPPMGEYSDRVLYLTRKEGYRTIFWSIAYYDWDVNKQPGKEFVYNHFLQNHHPGAIPLVHAVSSSNTEALDDVLKAMKSLGYRFGSLYELEQ